MTSFVVHDTWQGDECPVDPDIAGLGVSSMTRNNSIVDLKWVG